MLNRKLLVIYSAFLIDPLIMTSYNPLVPAIKTTFNVDITVVAFATTFHMLPLAIFCLFSGSLSDLTDRSKILMIGLFISSIGSLVNALSPNIAVFLLSRSIQGVGSALIMPIALALIGDITPKEAIGRAMGFNGMFNAFFCGSLGPLISGFLGEINWRFVSLYLSAYGLIISILSRIILRGIIPLQKKGSMRLVFQQIKNTARNRNFILLSAVGFFAMFVWAGMQPLISDTLSLPPLLLKKSEIGTIFSMVGFVGIVFSYIGGLLTDKVGAKTNMVFAGLVEILPLFLFIFANSYWSYLLLLSLFSGFNRITQTSRSTLVVGLSPEARGSASSITQFAQFLGFASAPVVMAQIYVFAGMNSVYLGNVLLKLLTLFLITLVRTEQSQ